MDACVAHAKWMFASRGIGCHDFCDGMRGWAAVAVLICHMMPAAVVPQLYLLADGPFAVAIFFSVSGFSLCCVQQKNATRSMLARWPRLAIPCAFHAALGSLITHPLDAPRLGYNLMYGVVGTFLGPPPQVGTPGASATLLKLWSMGNASQFQLWTMKYEYAASLALWLQLLMPPLTMRLSLRVVAGVLVLVWFPWLGFFAIGAAKHARWAEQDGSELACSVAVGALLASWLVPFAELSYAWHLLAAARVWLLFTVVERSALTRRALGCGASIFMGRISFSVYLCHSYVKAIMQPEGVKGALSAIAMSVGVGALLTFVDRWAIWASREWAASVLLAPPETPSSEETINVPPEEVEV